MKYTYDIAGRLYQVKRNDTLISTYSYDPDGNRLMKITPTDTTRGVYDAQDRLLSISTSHNLNISTTQYLYSPSGYLNMKIDTSTGDTTRYTYDATGNLIKVQMPNGDLIEYIIDATNRRVGRKLNGAYTARYIYTGDLRPVAELDSAGNIVARYIYAEKANVPEYVVKAGTTYRIITDHLGSPRMVVNTANGSIVARADYDEYGNISSSYDSLGIPFGFAGGLYDQHTKLVRFGARDYDASVGRWIEKVLCLT